MTNTTQELDADFQRAVSTFVNCEVLCCVSSLMSALIQWSPDGSFYDFFDTFIRYDENDNPIEVSEYWFISSFLAEKLEARGEIIAFDFFGHCVWGRTTTGQSICMDHVIQDIYLELLA